MPVDDAELKLMCDKAIAELNINGVRKYNLKQFIQTCTEITQQPTESDPQIMKDVIDNDLGTEMTTTRRQAIYDKLLEDKVTLELS
jgi:hypothetical protein